MFRLMNSAMMPRPGQYDFRRVDSGEFAHLVREAFDAGQLVSYCGYPQNADVLSKLTGRSISVSRNPTVLEDGDTLLIMTLPYRVGGLEKGRQVSADDFEYGVATFRL